MLHVTVEFCGIVRNHNINIEHYELALLSAPTPLPHAQEDCIDPGVVKGAGADTFALYEPTQ